MYDWRTMTEEERARVTAIRRARRYPKHSPPHWDLKGDYLYLISAACYEHVTIIGKGPDRMTECEAQVLQVCQEFGSETYAWYILPNHYHVLVRTEHIKELRLELRQFHGRLSFN